jgi:monofunctional biosynthetic peptidoglycan transglycosylase
MPAKTQNNHGFTGLLKSTMRLFFQLVFGLMVLVLAVIMLLRFVNPPTWSWKIQRELDPPAAYTGSFHQWVDIDQITPTVQLAVIASEDQRFPYHHGLDLQAIAKALEEADRGKRLRGASTLTQQTAKNLFLWSRRDLSRKVLELGLALLLELLWDKERILEVYLNIVEFGPGVFGISAASEYWFQASVESLTVKQASRLAAVLPNPWQYRVQPPTPYVAERALWIEQQMAQLGYAWLSAIHD